MLIIYYSLCYCRCFYVVSCQQLLTPPTGTRTPAIDRHLHDLDYVPPPESYKPGIAGLVLTSALEKLKETGIDTSRFDGRLPPYDTKKHSRNRSNSPHASGNTTPGGTRRPKWYAKSDESDEKTLTQVADIITRKKYLLKLCEALMVYGAPTHRQVFSKFTSVCLPLLLPSSCISVTFLSPHSSLYRNMF